MSMLALKVGEKELWFEPHSVFYELEMKDGTKFPMYDYYPSFLNPGFLLACQERDIKMETVSDLLAFQELVERDEYDLLAAHIRDYEIKSLCITNPDRRLFSDEFRPVPSATHTPVLVELGEGGVVRDVFDGLYRLGRRGDSLFTFQTATDNQGFSCPGLESWEQQIMNYRFRREGSEIRFMGTKKDLETSELYFGVELEVSTDLSFHELQYIVTQVEPKQDPFFFAKDDSSITPSRGFCYEVVTHPMTPRRQRKEWCILFEKLEKLHAAKGLDLNGDNSVFDLRTDLSNGLHIHLSRKAFSRTRKSESHLNRFVTAWNLWDMTSQKFYQAISRRPRLPKDHQYCRVHAALDGRTLARRLRDTAGGDHHSTCHVTSTTVELRVFQGWFNLDHILSCIDFAEATFEYTRDKCPIRHLSKGYVTHFSKWLKGTPHYKWTKAKETVQCV